MQIQPDYSHQLEKIAKALNSSSIPQWVVVLESALIGALFGITGQLLLKLFDNWWEIRKMRRVLYQDLLTMFQKVEYIMATTRDMPEEKRLAWREERLRAVLKFDGEAYLKNHQDVYMQLPERGAAETMYAVYHQILDEKRLLYVSVLANQLPADLVEENQLPRKYIKKFLGSAAAEDLLKRLHAIYEYSRSGTTEPMYGKCGTNQRLRFCRTG